MRHYQPIPFAISLAAGSLIALLGPVSASHAQDVGASSSDTPGMVRSKALIALRDGDGETAVRMAKRLTELDAASPSAMLLAADIQLRCGDPAEAVLWFDRYLKTRPNDLPDLWQRGIAL
jgi:predicted Zn-dependent protease